MLFRVENKRGQRVSHCGVLEFIAQEGMCYMPQWVRDALDYYLQQHVVVHVTTVLLAVAPITFESASADDGQHAALGW